MVILNDPLRESLHSPFRLNQILLLKNLLLSISIFYFSCLSSDALELDRADQKTEEGIRHLKVPGFGEDGRIAWELHANEVNFEEEGIYEAFDLVLKTLTGFNQSNAKSKKGLFEPGSGKAWGESMLEVEGKGFTAEGKRWLWRNKIEKGDQLIAFQEKGKVMFKETLLLDEREGKKKEGVRKDDLSFKTLTEAEYIEVLELSPTRNRFLLERNVVVSSEDLKISCDWMEILFDKDLNQTSPLKSLGKISKIHARGKVSMIQKGRSSFADELSINTTKGEAVLQGNARVEDQDYGIAKGDEIILEKGTRRAKVVGVEGNRPSLQLPEIPNFGFPN